MRVYQVAPSTKTNVCCHDPRVHISMTWDEAEDFMRRPRGAARIKVMSRLQVLLDAMLKEHAKLTRVITP